MVSVSLVRTREDLLSDRSKPGGPNWDRDQTAPRSRAMTARERLPDRRQCETFEIEAAGLPYIATIGRYSGGRIGEIFIRARKVGSAADTAARDAAITASIALQHGADAETIRRALCRDAAGRATGPLGVVLDLIEEDQRPCRPTTPASR